MATKIMFLDESGDHNLQVIDPSYPVFVLGGVIMDAEYARGELRERVRQFKLDLFGRDDLYLHTADISRNRAGFERLQDTAFRDEFRARLNELMRTLEYTVVACAIKKDRHVEKYKLAALDPYMLSLEILVERFCFEVGNRPGGGEIVAERRGPLLDRQLEIAWEALRSRGTDYLPPVAVDYRITGMHLRDKRSGLVGLELADLVVTPIGRHVMGKPDRDDYRIVESKFRRYRDRPEGAGLVVLPREDGGRKAKR